jgi:hypothetical protein
LTINFKKKNAAGDPAALIYPIYFTYKRRNRTTPIKQAFFRVVNIIGSFGKLIKKNGEIASMKIS